MADNLTDTAENLLLVWSLTSGAVTRPTMPLRLALCTTAPTDTTPGTEVTGGSYTRQNITITVTGGTGTNAAEARYTDMPAATITHVEIWDSAGTPARLWHGPLTEPKTTNAGDDFVIAAGDLDLAIS